MDTPIESVIFSNRARNILHRMGIHSTSDLIAFPLDTIARQPGVGTSTLEEISRCYKKLQDNHIVPVSADTSLLVANLVDEHKSYAIPSLPEAQKMRVKLHSIDELALSVRSKKVLVQNGYETIDQVAELTENDIIKFRGLGTKSMQEILRSTGEWLACHGVSTNSDNSDSTVLEKRKDQNDDSLHKVAQTNNTDEELERELARYSISELSLSVRAANILRSNHIVTMQQAAHLTAADLVEMRGCGLKVQTEILESVQEWIQDNIQTSSEIVEETGVNEETICYFKNISELLSPIVHVSWRKMLSLAQSNNVMDKTCAGVLTVDEDSLRSVLDIPEIQKGNRKYFHEIVPNGYILLEVLKNRLNEVSAKGDIFLESLVRNQHAVIIGDYLYLSKEQFSDSLSSFLGDTSDRSIKMLHMRVNGDSLQEIADEYGLTRERVRQILKKLIQRQPLFFEDYFREPFKHFKLTEEQFCTAFPNCNRQSFEYLSIRYDHGKDELTEKNLRKYTGPFRDLLFVQVAREKEQKERRTMSRAKLIYTVLLNNTEKALTIDEFYKVYNRYIEQKGYDREKLCLSTRTGSNILRVGHKIVFDRENRVRYCNVDTNALWRKINFNQYTNVVISGELIWHDYEELMVELDIRDGYELFYLLKSSCSAADQIRYKIYFRRVPTIVFGNGSEERQALQLLREISPIPYPDYFIAYEERYGVRRESASANPLIASCLVPYYSAGILSTKVTVFDDKDIYRLQRALAKKSFWFIDELEAVVDSVCTHSSEDAFNAAAFNRIGYTLNVSYAYPSDYGSVTNYFEEEIFDVDMLNLAEIDRRFMGLSAFTSALEKKKNSLELIETAPKILLSAAQVRKQYGITVSDLQKLQSDLSSYYDDEYFNAYSLWEDINAHPLIKRLNQNMWMLTCIMRQQYGICTLNVAGGMILSRTSSSLNLSNICAWIVNQEKKMSVKALTARINELFGTSITHGNISEKIKAAGMWDELVTDSLDDYLDGLLADTDFNDEDLFAEEFL